MHPITSVLALMANPLLVLACTPCTQSDKAPHPTPPPPHTTPGLTEVLTTGGIPPCIAEPCSAERVYQALFPRVVAQNSRYYARFPDDVGVVQHIVTFLADQPEGGLRLPSGTLLTPRAFQVLGLSGLGSGGELPGCVCVGGVFAVVPGACLSCCAQDMVSAVLVLQWT